jgi:hypothetical protein
MKEAECDKMAWCCSADHGLDAFYVLLYKLSSKEYMFKKIVCLKSDSL